MTSRHPSRLHICHERVGPRERDSRQPSPWICDLPAATWCFDCGHYVCRTHVNANHDGHQTQVEAAQ